MKNIVPISLILVLTFMQLACDNFIRDQVESPERTELVFSDLDSLEMQQWLNTICSYPHRRVGSTHWESAMQDIENILLEIGFEQIQKDYFDIQYWECSNWAFSVSDETTTLEIPSYYEYGTAFTSSDGLEAELVYIGRQVESTEDVAGKIAVIDLEFADEPTTGLPNPVSRPNHRSFEEGHILGGADAYWQAKDAGAVGVIFIMADFHQNVSEYMYIPHHTNLRALPVQFVGNRDGIKLRCYAQEGWTGKIIQEGIYETRQTYNLWTKLEGQSDENIIVSTHVDAPFRGIIEDGSGIVSVVAQAKEWRDQLLEARPKSMYFVFTAAHLYKDSPGGAVFATIYPEVMQESKVLIEIEHLGAIRQRVERDSFVQTDLLSPIGIYHSEDGYVEEELMNMVNNYPPPHDGIETIPPFFLFPYPLSEAAGWVAIAQDSLNLDFKYVSFITNPVYLLTIDDDFDKLNWDALLGANESILQLTQNYMENL